MQRCEMTGVHVIIIIGTFILFYFSHSTWILSKCQQLFINRNTNICWHISFFASLFGLQNSPYVGQWLCVYNTYESFIA